MEMVGDNSPFIFTSQHLLILTNNKKNTFHFVIFLKDSRRQESEFIKMLSTMPALHK